MTASLWKEEWNSMSTRRLAWLGIVLLAAGGCAARRIPGTDIEDNADTRAILYLLEKYRVAVEQKDTNTLIGLVSTSFKDNAGTATPDDDLDYQSLQQKLPQRFAKVDDVHLDVNIRKIDLNQDNGTASVIYYYNMSFRMPTMSTKLLSESEIKQMLLRREQGQWKIMSGV